MNNRTNEEERQLVFNRHAFERRIWKGIVEGHLVVVDKLRDRGIGKTISLKNIAETLDVKVLITSSNIAKELNDSYKTDVFIGGTSKDIEGKGIIKVLIDQDVSRKLLAKYDNIHVIGGVVEKDVNIVRLEDIFK